jgi:hypothetical protein
MADTTNSNAWINCSSEGLTDGSCSMNVYNTLWVHPKNKDLQSFSKDAFGWATMFIGFIVFIAITYSGFLMITGWADEKQFENGKKGLIYSIIGLLLVGWAYGIVRFIQLVANW